MTRSARAAKPVTQIDLTGLDAALIMGEDGFDEQAQAESPIIGQAAIPSPLGHQKSSYHERSSDNIGPREFLNGLHEPIASKPSIGEPLVPPRPAALRNTARATGKGSHSQREQGNVQPTHHNLEPLVSTPQECEQHVQETGKKKLREHQDGSHEAPASGPSVNEFKVPPLPEALRPRRNPPPNAITITFIVFEHGG